MINEITKKIYYDMQKFIFTNNTIVSASGFAIGIATKEALTSVLNLTVMKVLVLLKEQIMKHGISSYISVLIEIIWQIGAWIITILFIFLLLEYFLNQKIFGLASTIKNNSKTDFIKAKLEAKTTSIIPTSEDIHSINKTNETINELAQKKTTVKPLNIIDKETTDDNNDIDIHELYKY